MMLITRAPSQAEDEESELDVDGDDSAKSPVNTCEFCGSVLSRAVQRLRHKCASTFTCSYCAWKGSSDSELKEHELQLHQAKKPHVCAECGARWVSAAALSRHMSVHAKGKTTCACDGCGANFTTVRSLRRHGRDCPGMRDVNKPYLCKVCCATFISKMSLTKHVKVHSLKRPFSCSE
ncbi:zinc finger and BTB domain-containing protein 24-like [Frankliniella occidentalis]|uniref:Zinc finger and BTB domain-containing protein 24-like n=1 Tax=Frankliniella occidentalis TaxID=133901 RepID=A0A9C6X6U1_FRAOC|nr:zinc finger and BTB domain-containing protein 24-like [Frankliniella occidentalis]